MRTNSLGQPKGSFPPLGVWGDGGDHHAVERDAVSEGQRPGWGFSV